MIRLSTKNMRRGLYAITDDHVINCDDGLETIEAVLDAGAVMLQWRDKNRTGSADMLKSLPSLCHRYDATLIINDDIDLALAVGADGVHLGRDDMTTEEARHKLGADAIIGRSCYADPDAAHLQFASGSDYVAFGRVFVSPTKPEAPRVSLSLISDACKDLGCPVVAIGGITTRNAATLIDTGVDLIAVISGLWTGDEPAANAAKFKELFGISQKVE